MPGIEIAAPLLRPVFGLPAPGRGGRGPAAIIRTPFRRLLFCSHADDQRWTPSKMKAHELASAGSRAARRNTATGDAVLAGLALQMPSRSCNWRALLALDLDLDPDSARLKTLGGDLLLMDAAGEVLRRAGIPGNLMIRSAGLFTVAGLRGLAALGNHEMSIFLHGLSAHDLLALCRRLAAAADRSDADVRQRLGHRMSAAQDDRPRRVSDQVPEQDPRTATAST